MELEFKRKKATVLRSTKKQDPVRNLFLLARAVDSLSSVGAMHKL